MTELETLLQASVDLARKDKEITALKDENQLLRGRIRVLQARSQHQQQYPALLRPQAE